MIMLSVFCRSCGQRIEEEVDEQFPPTALRCECGARYRLRRSPQRPAVDMYRGGDRKSICRCISFQAQATHTS